MGTSPERDRPTDIAGQIEQEPEYVGEQYVEMLREVAGKTSPGGEMARAMLASIAFADGDAAVGHAELAALKASRPHSADACAYSALTLLGQSDSDGALEWFNAAVARLDPQAHGWLDNDAVMILNARRHVREDLGLPPDDWDEMIIEDRDRALLPLQRTAEFPTAQSMLDDLDDGQDFSHLSVVAALFWHRADLPEAQRRWPEITDPEIDADAYFRTLESQYRALSERGLAAIVLIPATPDQMAGYARQRGLGATDPQMRRDYTDEARVRGEGIPWPPPRNGPCWCGSGTKYKKCCGSPARR